MLTDLNLRTRSLTFVVLVLGVEVENRSRECEENFDSLL